MMRIDVYNKLIVSVLFFASVFSAQILGVITPEQKQSFLNRVIGIGEEAKQAKNDLDAAVALTNITALMNRLIDTEFIKDFDIWNESAVVLAEAMASYQDMVKESQSIVSEQQKTLLAKMKEIQAEVRKADDAQDLSMAETAFRSVLVFFNKTIATESLKDKAVVDALYNLLIEALIVYDRNYTNWWLEQPRGNFGGQPSDFEHFEKQGKYEKYFVD